MRGAGGWEWWCGGARRAVSVVSSACASAGLAAAIALGSAIAAAGPAQATDWIVNVSDAGHDPVPVNGTVVYTVTVTNDDLPNTSSPANTVVLTLAGNGTFTGGTGGIADCSPAPATAPATITCTVPPIPGDGSVVLQASVLATAVGSVSLAATVPTLGIDTQPGNNTATQSTTIVSGADLGLEITGPAPSAAGSIGNYDFTITNAGPFPASNITLNIPAPGGLTNVVAPPGCALSGASYVCLIPGPVPVGGSTTLTFIAQATANASSTITVIGTISGQSPADPNPSNNTDTFTASISSGSDLRIAKTVSPAGVLQIGQTASFSLSPAYTGDNPNSITITDTVPDQYAVASVVPSAGWTCSTSGRTVTCTRPSGTGAGSNVSLGSIEINVDVVSSGPATNSATIQAVSPPDPVPGNNTGNDGGVLITDPAVDLLADKVGPWPPLAVVGGLYPFYLRTRNLGINDFTGTIFMTDSLPAGLEVVTYNPNGWTCRMASGAAIVVPVVGPAQIRCERVYTAAAPLKVGEQTATAVLNVKSNVEGRISNTLTVTTENANWPDPDLINNTVNWEVGFQPEALAADLRVVKTAASGNLLSGELQTFTMEIVNAGPGPSNNVTFADDFTGLINSTAGAGQGFEGYTVTANSAAAPTCSTAVSSTTSRRLTCVFPTIPVCDPGVNCPTIVASVRPGGVAGTRTNRAAATSNLVADPDTTDNAGTVNYTIEPSADVTVSKTASNPTPAAGQNFTYVITARTVADGRSEAEDVTIEDTLPDGLVFLSAGPPSVTCTTSPTPNTVTAPGNNKLICDFGTILNGGQRSVTVLVRPTTAVRGASLTNSVEVSTSTAGDNPANNNAAVTVQVQNPSLDLQVNKSDNPDLISIGETTVYTLQIQNNGPSVAENVVVTDDLPTAGLVYLSHSVPPDGSCTVVPAARALGGQLVCSFPLLAAGQSRTITVTMEGAAKGVFANDVAVASTETALGFDTLTQNNIDREDTTVRSRVDLEVIKTASSPDVSLRVPFTYSIIVRNRADAGLFEADAVQLADSLPAGMELTGVPSATVTAGTATANTCAGAAGGTDFSCQFGTMSIGAEITVSVPVQVTAVSTTPQDFDNTATVATTSRDVDPANNESTATVTASAAVLSGKVFRDFNNNGVQDPGDTGIGGVAMEIAGAGPGGAPVTFTVTTAADGSYVSPPLPPGSFAVTRGPVNDPALSGGIAIPGTAGGSASGATVINGITLTDQAATDYDFTLVPAAGIGLVKTVASAPAANADGTFDVSFALEVRNPSSEALDTIVLSDPLAGAAPLFGSFAASLTAPGQYTVAAPPSGSCGGLNAGFNGASDQVVAQGFNLAAGASCTVSIALRVFPPAPPPAAYDNLASVTGEGSLSGEEVTAGSSASVTPPGFTPSIELLKSEGVLDDGGNGLNPGDTLAYTFTVTNTGTVTLSAVAVTDDKVANIVCAAATLAPGASTQCAGDPYVITQADLSAGEVENTATATGTPPSGPAVTDDDSSTTVLPALSLLGIEKVLIAHTDADGNGFVSPGDTLAYTITATNLGNTVLTNVVVTDSRITPDSETCASVIQAATCVLTGTLTVKLDDAQAGEIVNTASAVSTETGPVTASLTVPVKATADGDSLTKTALVSTVKRGERVPYVIRASDVPFSPARIVDIMPPGFSFVTGSATANGAAVTPVIDGRRLTFDGLVPDGEDDITLELTLLATSAAATGDNVNRAELVNPATGEVVATARARVTILEEAVFDCSDVIGKVFDDQNRNGYQDEGEPGLPGVRLATVRGLLVTTDPHGRFSIACADIPDADIGSNFIVKLDPRTLPTGYRITTENPRKVRLTRGKMVKLNFGAAISRLVTLDLNSRVFEQGSERLRPKWQSGLDRLVTALETESSTLRITYVGDDGALAAARILAVSEEIHARWKKAGAPYRLVIESRVVAAGGEGAQ